MEQCITHDYGVYIHARGQRCFYIYAISTVYVYIHLLPCVDLVAFTGFVAGLFVVASDILLTKRSLHHLILERLARRPNI